MQQPTGDLVASSAEHPLVLLVGHLLQTRAHLGAAGALGPALQSIGYSAGYHLFNAAPYALTLAIMVTSARPRQTLAGAPGELSLTR